MIRCVRIFYILLNPVLLIILVASSINLVEDESSTCDPVSHVVKSTLSFATATDQPTIPVPTRTPTTPVPTNAPTLDPTGKPTPWPTREPTHEPTRSPSDPPTPPTLAPTPYPDALNEQDIPFVIGEFADPGQNPWLAARNVTNNAVLQLGLDGTVVIDGANVGDVSGEQQCLLRSTTSPNLSFTKRCTVDTSSGTILIEVGTQLQQDYPFNAWDVSVGSRMLLTSARFGKLIICAGGQSSALPVSYDLASDAFQQRYSPRIFHSRFATASEASDLRPYAWTNARERLGDAGSMCYSVALNYLEDNPDVPFVATLVISLPGVSMRDWYPKRINSYSRETGYDQGFKQTETAHVEALVVQYGDEFMTSSDTSDFVSMYYNRFFNRYWREQHELSRIALVGVDVQDTAAAGVATQSRNRVRGAVVSNADARTTYVSVYDLQDPFYRSTSGTHLCSNSSDAEPWFINGWCDDDGLTFAGSAIGAPRLKAPIGYRAYRQMFRGDLPPQPVKLTVDAPDTARIEFDSPVAFTAGPSAAHPWRWNPSSKGTFWGFSTSSVDISSSTVTVSEDGLTVTLTREPGATQGIRRVAFAQTNFPCCAVIDDVASASPDELVCRPMACGLTLKSNPYIPVAEFRITP